MDVISFMDAMQPLEDSPHHSSSFLLFKKWFVKVLVLIFLYCQLVLPELIWIFVELELVSTESLVLAIIGRRTGVVFSGPCFLEVV